MRWRRFLAADAIGAPRWAVFAAMLGYLGGEACKDSLWKPHGITAVMAAIVATLGEGWRGLRAT